MQFQAPYDVSDLMRTQLAQRQAEQENQRANQEQMMASVAMLADQFSQNKQAAAKAGAYGEFLGMHGETLGINPEWLEQFKKSPRDQQIALGDLLIGNYLPHQQRMEYLNQQASAFGRGTGAGAGGAGGGGGGSGDYVVGGGWGG